MGSLIAGMKRASASRNSAQRMATVEKPSQMPRLKGSARKKPFWLPLLMDRMLLGPGVAAVVRE